MEITRHYSRNRTHNLVMLYSKKYQSFKKEFESIDKSKDCRNEVLDLINKYTLIELNEIANQIK